MNAAIGQIARPVARLRSAATGAPRRFVREQSLVAGAQLAAGAGNLVFALVAARLLAPGPFAQLVAFLALYLLIHVPASSLSAGSALSPQLAARGRRRALTWGLGGGALLAACSVPLAGVAGVPVALLLVLATVVPLAPWLALERGRLYGAGRHGRVAATLGVEPAVRLALGLPLAAGLGAVGGAVGVVLGGWAALAVARPCRAMPAGAARSPITLPSVAGGRARAAAPRVGAAASCRALVARSRLGSAAGNRVLAAQPPPEAAAGNGAAQRAARGAGLATAAFLVLAILQNQDVVLANGLLEPGEAGRFAVLSTLGGLAAFATTTVPLVLLPQAAGNERGALAAALGVAILLGGAAVAAVALVPSEFVGTAFGERYASVGALAVPYVAAMALFGVARVLVAHRCAQGGGRVLVALVVAIAVGQALALVLVGDDAARVAQITLWAMCVLALAALLAALPALLRPRPHPSLVRGVTAVTQRPAFATTRGGPTASVAPAPSLPAAVAGAVAPAPPVPATPAGPPPPTPDVPAAVQEPEPAPQRPRRAIAAVPDWVALAGLVVIAIAVRMAANRGIWLDEATSITQAQMPLGEMLDVLRSTDVHPPLYFLIVWGIAHTAGVSEIAMRAPSMLAGIAMIPVLYLLGRELYDRRAGLLAAALGTVAPFLVWYSQEARMYALFMLFAALAALAQVLILRRGGGARYWLMYALAAGALLWTQYFGVLFVAVQQAGFLIAAVSLRRSGRPAAGFVRGWLGSLALVVVLVAPVVPFAIDQFQANQAAGRGFNAPTNAGVGVSDPAQSTPGIYALLTNFVWGVGGYHSDATMAAITALWPLGMLGGLLALGRRRQPVSRLLLACALLPALVLFGLGFIKPFVFEIRYFAAAVPLLLVLIARGATGWVRGGAAALVLSAVAVITLAVASADQQLNRSNPRMYDFPGALTAIEQRSHPGDVILHQPPYLADLIAYYAPRLRAGALRDDIPRRRDTGRVFVIGSFLNEPRHAAATRRGLARLRQEWTLREDFHRRQVRVWVFEK